MQEWQHQMQVQVQNMKQCGVVSHISHTWCKGWNKDWKPTWKTCRYPHALTLFFTQWRDTLAHMYASFHTCESTYTLTLCFKQLHNKFMDMFASSSINTCAFYLHSHVYITHFTFVDRSTHSHINTHWCKNLAHGLHDVVNFYTTMQI